MHFTQAAWRSVGVLKHSDEYSTCKDTQNSGRITPDIVPSCRALSASGRRYVIKRTFVSYMRQRVKKLMLADFGM